MLYAGNPVYITERNDLLIVSNPKVVTDFSSFTLTYETQGQRYPFWQKPFVDKPDVYWHLFRVSLGLFIFLVISLFIHFFCVRPCWQKKPICCCKCLKKTPAYPVKEDSEIEELDKRLQNAKVIANKNGNIINRQ